MSKKMGAMVAVLAAVAVLFVCTGCSFNGSVGGKGESVQKAKVEKVSASDLEKAKVDSNARVATTDAEAKVLLNGTNFGGFDSGRMARSVQAVPAATRAASGAGEVHQLITEVTGFWNDLESKGKASLKLNESLSADAGIAGLALAGAEVDVNLNATAKGLADKNRANASVSLDGHVYAKGHAEIDPLNLAGDIFAGIDPSLKSYKVVTNADVNVKVGKLTAAASAANSADTSIASFDFSGSYGVSAAASVGTTCVTKDSSGNVIYGLVVVTASAQSKGDMEKLQAKAEAAYKSEKGDASAKFAAAFDEVVKADVEIAIYDNAGKKTWSKKLASVEALVDWLEK